MRTGKPKFLAIDFGTSNTVVSVWDVATNQPRPLYIPGISRVVKNGSTEMYVIPSMIYFDDKRNVSVGEQVLKANAATLPSCFIRMKNYIRDNSPSSKIICGRRISYQEAARTFLQKISEHLRTNLGSCDLKIALTVPVESFENYNEWLSQNFPTSDEGKFRLFDEPVAAAWANRVILGAQKPVLIFDFGGGTLDVAIVVADEPESDGTPRCRVIAKGAAELGGQDIDNLLMDEVLRQNKIEKNSEEAREVEPLLRPECEDVKEKLSTREQASILLLAPSTGRVLKSSFTRQDLEELLHVNGIYQRIETCLELTLKRAHERGFEASHISRVILTGGGSLIPSVQQLLKRRFGNCVLSESPLESVARGAAMLAAGAKCTDHIQHSYAIKARNRASGAYEYHIIVPSGTVYPSDGVVAEKTLIATSEGQVKFGIEVFEISTLTKVAADNRATKTLSQSALMQCPHRFLNESAATFLIADPPANKGDERFKVQFLLDENRRLSICSTDLFTNRSTHQNYPIIQLR